MANRSTMTENIDQLFKLSAIRLSELEENVHLSRTYHDGRTMVAQRALEKQQKMHAIILQLRAEIYSNEGDIYAPGRW